MKLPQCPVGWLCPRFLSPGVHPDRVGGAIAPTTVDPSRDEGLPRSARIIPRKRIGRRNDAAIGAIAAAGQPPATGRPLGDRNRTRRLDGQGLWVVGRQPRRRGDDPRITRRPRFAGPLSRMRTPGDPSLQPSARRSVRCLRFRSRDRGEADISWRRRDTAAIESDGQATTPTSPQTIAGRLKRRPSRAATVSFDVSRCTVTCYCRRMYGPAKASKFRCTWRSSPACSS